MVTYLFIHDVLYADSRLGSTKKPCYTQKTVVSTKKILHMEVNVAQQNYVSHKKICCGYKKNCDTQKKTYVD